MHKDELRQLLSDCAAERLGILQRHEAAARVVSNYDFNNTYQYVIAREETHLSWLQNALAEFGVSLPAAALQYTLRDDTVRSIVVGGSKPEQLRQNAARMTDPIPDELWDALVEKDLIPA